jgi:hypothetical protein
MVRKLVELDPAQADAVKRIARRRRVPEASVLREAVTDYLAGHDQPESGPPADHPLWAIVGIGKHGPTDGSVNYKRDLYGEREPKA